MKSLVCSLFLLLSVASVRAEGKFEFTPDAKEAYELALSLRFEEARQKIRYVKFSDPDNLIVHFIENYIDFFTVFITENERDFERLEQNKDYRIKMIKRGDKNSPYYNFLQAEIKLQWAVARLKFEEYFTAFSEISSAYKLLNRNQRKFPNFVANKKSLGILHALVGTIPDSYRWGVKLLGGMSGTIQQGQKEITEVLDYAQNNDFIFEEETMVMYAFLMLHLKNQSEAAWNVIRSDKLNPKKNPLACFALANLAMRTGRNDEAIKVLEQRPRGDNFFPFPYLDYKLGLAKLYRLDENADQYLLRFLSDFRGRHYIKEAYQKLAWYHLINGRDAKYQFYINQAGSKGNKVIDEDKNALKEAKKGHRSEASLLKARLLFDGGYYNRALRILQKRSPKSYYKKQDQLEYTYRLGRITHKLNQSDKAIPYYQQTINEGEEEKYFYACNAALQMGIIYEKAQQRDKAIKYYKACLSMKPDEYKNGLHQKAKAGLNRLDY
ncbi:MAG: tetratricopeptide repeat protein [Saprospiraceae bacterium]